jgi:hypothetical protein
MEFSVYDVNQIGTLAKVYRRIFCNKGYGTLEATGLCRANLMFPLVTGMPGATYLYRLAGNSGILP